MGAVPNVRSVLAAGTGLHALFATFASTLSNRRVVDFRSFPDKRAGEVAPLLPFAWGDQTAGF
jgi:hypothetical protein